MEDKFSTLALNPAWISNLDQLGYSRMTPIQSKALPVMLAGKDVIGLASTGSGKTAAFGLALLARVSPASQLPTAIVLCPTRELAAQVAEEIRRLARPLANTNVLVITGGTSYGRQRVALENGVDIVVGTPGRVLDHVTRESLDLSKVQTLVLDEADRMLDMGFVEDVLTIVRETPEKRQTLLFSATTHQDVMDLSASLQDNARYISVEEEATPNITQVLYALGYEDRFDALALVLGHHRPESAVVFCGQRKTVDEVCDGLNELGYSAMALHGGMEQRDREDVLLMFSNGSVRVLVATDVAARGIDIEDLGAVINYELPREGKDFLHRVGRTGRAGESGLAISLMGKSERRKLARIHLLSGVDPVEVAELDERRDLPPFAKMKTIKLMGGRKDKVRPGDIVGALTGEVGLSKDDIGRISVLDRISHIAVERSVAARALEGITTGKIKGRRFKARFL